ncbi:hypothetical protein [Neobacillus niacini]|uniref:hypothetical protein n=1 Tax=Neobacillus niacini TaxID=86668 RepID=UPI0005EFE75C|nr:hypothetical protein [Neobacillus niacini]
MTEFIQATGLERLINYKVDELKKALEGQIIFIELQKDVDESGEDVFFILVVDKEQTLTTIKCDDKGWSARYEMFTPGHIKTAVENTMNGIDKDWRMQWQKFYHEELEKILNDEILELDEIKAGTRFLKSLDENMNNILADLKHISEAFEEYEIGEIMFYGAKNLFGEEFEYKDCFGQQIGIVKFYNENYQLIFDPFVLEDEMKAEFIARNDGFFFTINLYESNPEEIYFFIEY